MLSRTFQTCLRGLRFAIVLMLAVAPGLTVFGATEDSEPIAMVNNTPITRETLKWVAGLADDPAYPSYESQEKIMAQLVNRELLYQESISADISVSENEINKRLNRITKSLRTSQSVFRQKIGLSADDVALEVKKDIAIDKLLRQELPRQRQVTTEEAMAYYQANLDQFTVEGPVHVRHILIAVAPAADDETRAEARMRIDDILAQLRTGAEFSEMAKKYSEGPSRIKGGDVGWVNHGQKNKTFEAAAFSLAPGQISDVVETPLGFHVLTVTEKKPPMVVDYEKVDKQIKQYLFNEKRQSQINELVQNLKLNADIRIYR